MYFCTGGSPVEWEGGGVNSKDTHSSPLQPLPYLVSCIFGRHMHMRSYVCMLVTYYYVLLNITTHKHTHTLRCMLHTGCLHLTYNSSISSYLTICSIFFFHLGSIRCRYSGLISIAAKVNADTLRPARWHSITVDVRMGTTSIRYGNIHTLEYESSASGRYLQSTGL